MKRRGGIARALTHTPRGSARSGRTIGLAAGPCCRSWRGRATPGRPGGAPATRRRWRHTRPCHGYAPWAPSPAGTPPRTAAQGAAPPACQDVADRGQDVDLRRAAVRHLAPERGGAEPGHEQERSPRGERPAQGIEQGVHVEQGQHREQPVVGLQIHPLDEHFACQSEVPLAVHDALGEPRRAGRVQNHAGVVRAGVGSAVRR
jgi:hypothetical protein